MHITISFKQIESSEALKTFITEKTETLTKYFQGKISVEWHISIDNQNKVAHCHLVGNNMDYFGEGATDDFRVSVDAALDKVEKQSRKHKEIVKDHLHHRGGNSNGAIGDEA